MADVPLAVAVIGTITPVVAGALPLFIGWFKEGGRDKRERAERLEAERLRLAQEKRGECVKLLRLGRDLRVLMENAHESQGDDLTLRLQEIRQSAAGLTGQADEVGFMVPETEAAAGALAAAAGRLVITVSENRNRAGGAPLMPPDFERFDRCLAKFKADAQAALSPQPAPRAAIADGVMGAQLPRLVAADGHAP
jgi:hypothetical protein